MFLFLGGEGEDGGAFGVLLTGGGGGNLTQIRQKEEEERKGESSMGKVGSPPNIHPTLLNYPFCPVYFPGPSSLTMRKASIPLLFPFPPRIAFSFSPQGRRRSCPLLLFFFESPLPISIQSRGGGKGGEENEHCYTAHAFLPSLPHCPNRPRGIQQVPEI